MVDVRPVFGLFWAYLLFMAKIAFTCTSYGNIFSDRQKKKSTMVFLSRETKFGIVLHVKKTQRWLVLFTIRASVKVKCAGKYQRNVEMTP